MSIELEELLLMSLVNMNNNYRQWNLIYTAGLSVVFVFEGSETDMITCRFECGVCA